MTRFRYLEPLTGGFPADDWHTAMKDFVNVELWEVLYVGPIEVQVEREKAKRRAIKGYPVVSVKMLKPYRASVFLQGQHRQCFAVRSPKELRKVLTEMLAKQAEQALSNPYIVCDNCGAKDRAHCVCDERQEDREQDELDEMEYRDWWD